MKNNKFKCFLKKAFSGRMAIVSSIVALLLVGATLALLFSKGNTVTNTFNPGKVDVKVNESINDQPELVNNDPYGDGWMIKIQIANPAELETLLDAEAYKALIGA